MTNGKKMERPPKVVSLRPDNGIRPGMPASPTKILGQENVPRPESAEAIAHQIKETLGSTRAPWAQEKPNSWWQRAALPFQRDNISLVELEDKLKRAKELGASEWIKSPAEFYAMASIYLNRKQDGDPE